MSPVPTATREQYGQRPNPVLPLPTADLFLAMSKEMVVDWQLADLERMS